MNPYIRDIHLKNIETHESDITNYATVVNNVWTAGSENDRW